ncbi:uncharacterized protein E0L32_011139 [Thyridium curvatum]|uniref:Ilp is an apoptosis inhibitor n=1 Tax=Thyridium curvatum TaxID=1093900 RepID=A0A507AD76_9PEZI|nr:uncharacterized protein E0L32_011139 [Thyridium curvatum]TPX06915.1 hypothetical protein E0L32_011139 [Thyridium curvatum]
MAFPRPGGNSSLQQSEPFVDSGFDIFEWHEQFQSCVRYFVDHAQHHGPIQAVAAFVNIQLPFQSAVRPILSSAGTASPSPVPAPGSSSSSSSASRPPPPPPPQSIPLGAVHSPSPLSRVSLVPYIRRLVATGFDFPAVLHGFFGDDWMAGIGPLLEAERRNYLFAAKSDTWLQVKTSYDMADGQTVPFLRPLQNVSEKEIVVAETNWSEWLAMQDWMLGPRAPEDERGGIKQED